MRVALALAPLALTACTLVAPAPPTRFAVLATAEELAGGAEPPASESPSALRVGLGPLALPDYLRRLALVERDGTALAPSETDLWGEPLEQGLARVLAADLRHALGDARVVLYPWYESERPDVQVEIAFSRFERVAPDRVLLAASYRLRRLDGGDGAPFERETRIERAAEAGGPACARALSEALVELCAEITRAWPGGR